MIGEDVTGACRLLPAGMDVLQARLRPGKEAAAYAGRRVLAFAGIGRPQKFFAMLEAGGIEVVRRLGFPDHHVFSAAELQHLAELADRLGVTAVTTPKDFARIPAECRAPFQQIGVNLAWEDERRLEALLRECLAVPGRRV